MTTNLEGLQDIKYQEQIITTEQTTRVTKYVHDWLFQNIAVQSLTGIKLFNYSYISTMLVLSRKLMYVL